MQQHSDVAREQRRVARAHKVFLDTDRIELAVVLLLDLLQSVDPSCGVCARAQSARVYSVARISPLKRTLRAAVAYVLLWRTMSRTTREGLR